MDYTKMLKKELIEQLEVKNAKLLEVKNTDGEIRARDKTISDLNNEISKLKRKTPSDELLRQQKILTQKVKDELKEYKEQVDEKVKQKIDNIVEKTTKEVEMYKEALKSAQDQLNGSVDSKLLSTREAQLSNFITAHGALLKTIQGALDTALGYNEFLTLQVEATNQQKIK